MFDRTRIRSAIDRADITLRAWQRGALMQATNPQAPDAGLITATMGAGKSIAIALLCAGWDGRVVVTTPTIALTEQLRGTIASVCAETIGAYYTHDRRIERVTVCCLASVERLAGEWVADGDTLLICDEAHRTERASVKVLVEALGAARRVGFSATPYQADPNGRLSLWTHEAYRYTVAQAVADGALVPMRLMLPKSSELRRDELGRVDADDWIAELVPTLTGPGVISARDIADAEGYAAELCAAGVAAEALHSRMSRKASMAALERLRAGETKALVHCHMLSEGVDLPWLRWLVLRHPRGSRVEFAQEIGRVLRANPGKDYGVVVDPWEKTLEHELQDVAAIGDAIERTTVAGQVEDVVLIDPLTGEPLGRLEDMPASERKAFQMRTEVAIYVARSVVVLRAGGLIVPKVKDGKWRKRPATDRQWAFLTKFEKTARFALQQMGRMNGVDGQDAQQVRAVAYCVQRLLQAEKAQSGIVADACNVARVVLWGFGDDRDGLQPEALRMLAQWEVDPSSVLVACGAKAG